MFQPTCYLLAIIKLALTIIHHIFHFQSMKLHTSTFLTKDIGIRRFGPHLVQEEILLLCLYHSSSVLSEEGGNTEHIHTSRLLQLPHANVSPNEHSRPAHTITGWLEGGGGGGGRGEGGRECEIGT